MGYLQRVSNYLVSNETPDLPTEFTKEIDVARREPKPATGILKYLPFLLIFNYYPSHYSKFERRLLMKLDLCVALYLGFDFYTKHLDASNITSAYVSNMKEDLNLYGNELNYFTTYYSIGYCIGQIPAVLVANKKGWARYLLLGNQCLWGICTFCLSAVTNAREVYALRFLIGLFESASFPVSYLVMSSWYTPDELYLRAAIFNLCSQIGALSSGFLQTAAHRLNGVGTSVTGVPMSGWRWQFIVDGLITVVICLIWVFLFPGTFAHKKFGILSQDDLVLARKRMADANTEPPKKWDRRTWKLITTSWKPYLLVLLWVGHHQVGYSSGFSLFLKSKPKKYSLDDRTNFPTLIPAVGALLAFITPPLQHKYGKHQIINPIFLIMYFQDIVLIIWNVSDKLKFAAFALQGVFVGLAPTFYAWAAIICKESAEMKALTLGLMNALSYATQAWTPILQWPQKDGPRFWLGYRVDIAMIVATHIFFFAVWFLERRDNKKNVSQDIEDSTTVSEEEEEVISIQYEFKKEKL